MDQALSILDRALKGDTGALTFLERTSAIYVYDCTTNPGSDPSRAKIFGAWDFLNQALHEIERHEAVALASLSNTSMVHKDFVVLDPHVQLLATMARRAARRSSASDRRLVEVCLSNAAHFHEHGSNEYGHYLTENNQQMRNRVMGRIATITFDFGNHVHVTNSSHSFASAFLNPICMDNLCSVVATNAIATGPHEFSSFVLGWIIPSMNAMPPYSVASVVYHLAVEALAKSAPRGSQDMLKNLFDPLLGKVIAPLLQESVRNSDNGDSEMMGCDRNNNQRVAAMTFKALEKWCSAISCGMKKVRDVCLNNNFDIIEVISDSMYSDSELVMDSLSEFLETTLRKNINHQPIFQELATAANSVTKDIASIAIPDLARAETEMESEMKERESILTELVSAIGLQRFRFGARLSSGDLGVCRCLVSIARSLAEASQLILRSKILNGIEKGMIELLVKAISHPSRHVYSLALEAFAFLLNQDDDLATQILPILQSKAIIPPSLVGLSSSYDLDMDFDEFERFREFHLNDILCTCYINCRSYYIDSCCMAVEEFCTMAPNSHTPFQLEAAFFCLSAVSFDASKRALLANATPRSLEAVARASSSQLPGTKKLDINIIATDAANHDEKLARCILLLSKCNMIPSFSNPFLLCQICKLLGRYANWLSKTNKSGVFDAAAGLVMFCFKEAATKFGQKTGLLEEMSSSPFAEATSALRSMITRSPQRFANDECLTILESGWLYVYSTPGDKGVAVNIEDRITLCAGITKVISALPHDKWSYSLLNLVGPTIDRIERLLMSIKDDRERTGSQESLDTRVTDISKEFRVFACIVRTFHEAVKSQSNFDLDRRHLPLLGLLHRVWPSVTHVAKTLCRNEMAISSISEILLTVTSLHCDGQDSALLNEACGIAESVLDSVSSEQNVAQNIAPLMEFVKEMVESFGHKAEIHDAKACSHLSSSKSYDCSIQIITEKLLKKSFHVLQNNQFNGDVLPDFFSLSQSCIRHCPSLFMTLDAVPNQTNNIYSMTVKAAISSITNRQIDVIRASLLYLNEIFISLTLPNDSHEMSSKGKTLEIINPFRSELIQVLMNGSCGIFPREILDPVGMLLVSILKTTFPNESEQLCVKALSSDAFRLGDDAKNEVLVILRKCWQASITPNAIMDMLDDIWILHQNDENGDTVVGGDAILRFIKKYESLK